MTRLVIVSRFVPLIVIAAPTAPLVGVKLSRVGVSNTIKFEPLATEPPDVVTDIGPSAALAGTVAVMLVEELTVAEAVTPLKNSTVTGSEKSVPVISMVAPTAPLAGLKSVIVGGCAQVITGISINNRIENLIFTASRIISKKSQKNKLSIR